MHALEVLDGVFLLEDLRVDPVELDPDLVGDAAVGQGLGQRLVAVEEMRVLADDGDVNLALRLPDAARTGGS